MQISKGAKTAPRCEAVAKCLQVKDECEFVCGDPRYQPPETLRALVAHLKGQETKQLDRAIGFEADIWSLGATLFELLSGGVIPFIYEALHLDSVTHDAKRWETLKLKVFEEDLELDPWLTDASEPARQLIEKMLQKDASSRPSALEVLEARGALKRKKHGPLRVWSYRNRWISEALGLEP